MGSLQTLLNRNVPLVKICGNKFESEVLKVASFKPDFMGWIFSPFSPRKIELKDAIKQFYTIKEKHNEILTVAVFSGNPMNEILHIVKSLNEFNCIDLIQVTEDSTFIKNLKMELEKHDLSIPVVPVIRPQAIITEDIFSPFEPSQLYILDRFDPEKRGGTGKQIPPEYFKNSIKKNFLVAGGINSSNVLEILQYSKAMGVDLSSGVEDSPGIKNEKKLEELFFKVKNFKILDV